MNPESTDSRRGGIVAFLFFLSGFSALVYEVVWVRMLSMYVGGGAFSVSIVLTVFMAGLALGSAIAARFVDRIRRPADAMAMYGFVEIAIGAYGLMYPLLMIATRPCYAFLYRRMCESTLGYNAASAVISVLVLIVPTTLMGMTLPLLVRYSLDRDSRIGTDIGRLYGVNTIGGALGALGCGFVAVKWLGVGGTQALAVIINLFVGVAAISLFADRDSYVRLRADIGATERAPAARRIAGLNMAAVWIVLAVSGFCAMSYEVIWTKLLALLVGPTTYSFTIVLFTFITGLALGSLIFGRMADRSRNPMALMAGCQIAAALSAVLVSQALGNSQVFFAKLIFEHRENVITMEAVKGAAVFLFMLPPTLFLGGVFPLANRIRNAGIEHAGSDAGSLYVANTIGAVAGSFAAGFILVPLLGKALSVSVTTAVQAGIGVAVLAGMAVFSGPGRPAYTRGGIAAGLAVCCLCVFLPRWDAASLAKGMYQRFFGMERGLSRISYSEALLMGGDRIAEIREEPDTDRIISIADGTEGFVCVGESVNSVGHTNLFLAISGKIDASTGSDMATMALSGHIPLLFHDNKGGGIDALVVGLASGITAGEMLNYPVKNVDILEISPEVVKACAYFSGWNNNVLKDARARVIVQDARTHLTLTDRKYDVIMSEPSNPWMAGVAGLFTEDYFWKVRDRLEPGGIFVQWFHSYQMDWDMFSMFGRTISRVFPRSVVFKTSSVGSDYLVVCWADADSSLLDIRIAEANMEYARQSKNMKLRDPQRLYPLVIAENLGEMCGAGPVHTDNRPVMEYLAPHRMYRDRADFSDLVLEKRRVSDTTMLVISAQMIPSNRVGFAELMASFNAPPFGMVTEEELGEGETADYAAILTAFCRVNPIPDAGRLSPFEKRICMDSQEELMLARLAALGAERTHASAMHAARLYNQLGLFSVARADFAGAERRFAAAVVQHSGYVAALKNLAASQERQSRLADAVRTLRILEKREGKSPESHARIGMNLLGQKQDDAAIAEFNEAVRLKPDYAPALAVLGGVHGSRGDMALCVEYSTKAVEADPKQIRAYQNLGAALAAAGKRDEALQWLIKGLVIDPDDQGLLAVMQMLHASEQPK